MPTRRATTWRWTRRRISSWRRNSGAAEQWRRLLFPASVVGSLPRPAFVQDLINDQPPLSPERYEARDGRGDPLHRRHAGARRARCRHRRRMVAQILHRRHRRTRARIRTRHNPRTAGPGRSSSTSSRPKHPGFIAQEVAFLKRITTARSSPRCRRPRCSASGCGIRRNPPRPIRSATISCATACRSCGANWNWCATPARHRADRRSASVPVRRSGRCARSTPDPDAAADFAVDMVNAVVSGIEWRKDRRASLPPRRRARRGEASSRAATTRSSSSSTGSRCTTSRWSSPRPAPATWRSSGSCARISRSASAASA